MSLHKSAIKITFEQIPIGERKLKVKTVARILKAALARKNHIERKASNNGKPTVRGWIYKNCK